VPELTASSPYVAASLAPHDVLRSTWALFQLSWPSCLPLALVGVTASGVPGAEAVARGASHDPQWWGLYGASMALMLICYGALTLRQVSIADLAPLPVFEALRRSALALPALVVAVLPGFAGWIWLWFAWPCVLVDGRGPVAALRASVRMVKGRFWPLAGVYATALAAVLVFVVLAGIFVGVLMAVAGQQGPTSVVGRMLSRLLFGVVVALPVVYVGALHVVTWRTLRAPSRG
jgi:hypothetical protein